LLTNAIRPPRRPPQQARRKGGRQAAGGFLIAEEAAGAAALSDHCPRKIQQAAYGPYDNPSTPKDETLVRSFSSALRTRQKLSRTQETTL
jgi:hypothetical protein